MRTTLPDWPLVADGSLTQRLRALGITDIAAAGRYVRQLPYGRTSSRTDVTLVMTEGRGTCTTKHALLAALAEEQGIALALTLGIYEMTERNTPGVGRVLARYGFAAIPEAHCYLTHAGERIDVTREVEAAESIHAFLHEETIRVDQIGAYKIDLHRRVLADWIARTPALRGRALDDVWRIREECIAALSV